MKKPSVPTLSPIAGNASVNPAWMTYFNLLTLAATEWQPPTFADADAANNTIYYSTTAGKLVYKNSSGTVNNLY